MLIDPCFLRCLICSSFLQVYRGENCSRAKRKIVRKKMMMTEMSDHEKRRGYHDGFLLPSGGCSSNNKKLRIGQNSPKEKKDKVGESVAALQQLVSPFGKTDTASVLNEATEYINFLHDQLQVLSAPYLGTGPNDNMQKGEQYCSLRSRGLCLMPKDSALRIARSNGADLWAPTDTRLKRLHPK